MMMIIDRVENRENPTSFAPNRAILSYHLSKQHIRTNFHYNLHSTFYGEAKCRFT